MAIHNVELGAERERESSDPFGEQVAAPAFFSPLAGYQKKRKKTRGKEKMGRSVIDARHSAQLGGNRFRTAAVQIQLGQLLAIRRRHYANQIPTELQQDY